MIPRKILSLASRPCPVCRHRHKEYTEIIDTKVIACEPAGIVTNCMHCHHQDYYCDARITKRLHMDNADGLRLGRTILIDPHIPRGYHYMSDHCNQRFPRPFGNLSYENIHPYELDFKVTIDERYEDRYH